MPSLRPRWPSSRRPADAGHLGGRPRPVPAVICSWVDDALVLWGWDGEHTALPNALDSAISRSPWPTSSAAFGHLTSFDLTLPDGRVVRPTARRIPGGRAAPSLAALDPVGATDSVGWFAAVARVADATVSAGLVTPRLRTERDLPVARWLVLADPALDHALHELAAAMPPICRPGDNPGDTGAGASGIGVIHGAFVDAIARRRLALSGWRPSLPSSRTPAVSAARGVFNALSIEDPLITGSAVAHPDELAALGARFERHHRRCLGEPVVLPRVRLVVPDDPYDDWEVRLEVVDETDPGRWCSAEDVWDASPLACEIAGGEAHLDVLVGVVGDLAAALAAHVEQAAELSSVHEPAAIELTVEDAERFLEHAPAELERLGIELVGPERLLRAHVAVRGTATPATRSDHPGQFGRTAIVDWRMVVADDDGPAAITAAELARAETAGATLLHTGRRWVRIDPAALRRARRRLLDHRADHELVDAVTLLRLAGDGELEPGQPADAATTVAVADWTAALLGGLPDERLEEEHEPAGFSGELRHYQRRGLSWLRFLDRLGLGGCLADDMGLGKTATTLAHLLDRPGPHLVICPLSVVHNWEAEAARFAPALRVVVHHGAERARRAADQDDGGLDTSDLAAADLVVTTYGLLARDVEHLAAVRWTTAVADEAQMIKNPATHAAKAFRALSADQKVALTGTPVENRLTDLWAILDAVNPGMLGSRERFRHRFAKPIERDGDGDAAVRLRRITQPFVLRRTKADRTLVPDLPDKIEQIAWAGLTKEQAVLYQHVVDQLLADAATATGMKRRGLVLAALTRLKQICNHPAHVLGDGSRLSGRSGKLARYDELVDELLDVGERALVFTQFRQMGELLRRHAAERLELQVPFLHGGVTANRRRAMVDDFQAGAGPPLLLVSLKAGGTGLNLTAASQVIHFDRWWNPAVEDQATDRAWRIGQGRTVVVHKLVCEGTVEERIATLIDQKRALADAVVGSGESWLSELSTAELRELVQLDARG
ncbi:MAG: SNF2-related protein [Ilumatobacteraceae bacterium]